MPRSHVQNVFCLAHQIITPTQDYSHLGCSSQLRDALTIRRQAAKYIQRDRETKRDLLQAFAESYLFRMGNTKTQMKRKI